jgi:hypothetical protein
MDWVVGHENGHARGLRNHSVQQLHAFDVQFSFYVGHTCNVAAGMREALYKPGAYRVGDKDHDNRDGRRCTLGSDDSGGCVSDDDIGFQRNELGRKA